MNRNLLFYNALIIMLTVVINACTTTTLKTEWLDKTYHEDPFKKVLIIGVFYNEEEKIIFENELAQQMVLREINAISSNTIFKEYKMLEKEMIEKALNELGIDSVLVARLVKVDEVGTYYEPQTYITGGFYNYYVQCCQNPVSSGRNIMIEIKFFQARQDKLLWSALSETILDGSFEKVTKSLIPYIIKDLHDKKLIQ